MVAVPPAVLDMLELEVGAVVGMVVDDGRLVIHPQRKPRYTLEELLAQCDPLAPFSAEDREWLEMESVGEEL